MNVRSKPAADLEPGDDTVAYGKVLTVEETENHMVRISYDSKTTLKCRPDYPLKVWAD